MNKKVLTLCASFLLAGGLTSQAFADSFKNAAANYGEGQYFYVNVSKNAAGPGSSQLDVNGTVENPSYIISKEENRSTWWRLEAVKQTVNGSEKVIGYKLINALTGKPFTVVDATDNNKAYDTFNVEDDTYLGFVAADGTTSKYFGGSLTSVLSNTTNAWKYDLEAVPVEKLTKDEVNKVNNGYFGLQFGYIKDNKYVNYESLQGVDPLVGKLVAKNTPFADDNNAGIRVEIKPEADSYFIYNETADAYVVLLKEKWSKYNTNLTPASEVGKGHKFALMTAKQIIEDQAKAEKDQVISTLSFKVNMPVVVDYSPLEVVAVNATTPSGTSLVEKDLEMLISNMDGKDYLTTTVADEGTIVGTQKDNELTVPVDPVNTVVRFGMTDYTDMSEFYGWAITIKGIEGEGIEGMTIQPNVQNETNLQPSDVWTKADYVAFSRPEAQWIVTVENAAIYLTNRETKAKIRWNEAFDMITGNEDAPNTFALRKESGDTYVYQKDANTAYRFEIKKVEELGKDSWDDYGVYYQDDSEIGTTRTYKVTFADAFGTTSYVGMDGKGNVELTRDEAAAINFDLIRTQTTDTLNNDGTIAENAKKDVFQIYNNIMAKNKDGEWELKANGDTLSFYRYKLAFGDKFLNYNEAKKQFELVDEEVVYTEDSKNDDDKVVDYGKSTLADNYVVKLKENDKLNIIKVLNYEMEEIQRGEYDATEGNQFKENIAITKISSNDAMFTDDNWANNREGEKVLANGEKLFFDFNGAEVQKQQNIYAWEPNAQLTIVPQTLDSYRYFATPDTMEFYRVEYSDEFLYEKVQNGINFLGMTYNRDKYNPAIYVDTAYIQNTKKPTYLLALAPEIEPSHKYCPTHGIDPDASVCVPEHQTTIPGYVTARYLVSFTDSVAAHATELKNPYLEDGKYTKLGFVDAVHGVNDVNIIQNGDTVKTYELTDAAAKVALNPVEFAFRIANQETKSFYIESVDNGKVSYIRWQNGVPVLTTDITDAEEFNVRETSENPTANEEISAEEATVSVVATDGAVIVKGAEGKNVIVSTILGKVVANEVVNSDNETIAAPAGIVVVSVDGESFKVAVK